MILVYPRYKDRKTLILQFWKQLGQTDIIDDNQIKKITDRKINRHKYREKVFNLAEQQIINL